MYRFTLHAFVLISFASLGQSKLRRFSNIINHPSINVFAPYISADNRSLVYLSDNTTDNVLALFYTKKIDAVNWREPVIIPKSVINGRLTFSRGFALSTDGKLLYITSLQEGGLGGFDIHTSTLNGSVWSVPINIGMPVNSSQQEGAPSISSDGSTLYFMRCQSMRQNKAEGCTIMVSKRLRTGMWEEPTVLPDYINTGNSQVPRIMADSETLLFSSDRFPQNKGNMDLYLTRFDGKRWSTPTPLDFANTEGDDQYVSVAAFGRYLLKDQPGSNANEIVEILFPTPLKPKACMRVEGKITGLSDPSSPYINVFDRQKKAQIYNGSPDENGLFVLYLKEGRYYDVAVEPSKGSYTFYSKGYDLTKNNITMSSRMNVEIAPVSANTETSLEGITFEPHTAKLTAESSQELRRLTRMIKGNPGYNFVIEIVFDGYRSDSIQSDIDLTEQILDTLHFTVTHLVEDTVAVVIPKEIDSVAALEIYDSTSVQREKANYPTTVTLDSVVIKPTYHNNRTVAQAKEIDSATTLKIYDSTSVQREKANYPTTVTLDSVVIKPTYHNNRTVAQAKTIVDHLIKQGISADRLTQSYRVNLEVSLEKLEEKTSIRVKTFR